MAGISPRTGREPAVSIVMSGGYEDDRDDGDEVLYTGEGGNDASARRQIADQTLTKGNLALARNLTLGTPVRVFRGHRLDSKYAPPVGYRYDGLYRVEDMWAASGIAGFRIYRFRLRRSEGQAAPWTVQPGVLGPAPRTAGWVQRVVRDSALSRRVKELHGFRCQVCGITIETAGGFYAEGAHIRPLGSPHDGPDVEENILCLCPNHHVMFDLGSLTVGDDLGIVGAPGKLRLVDGHLPGQDFLRYHREHYAELRRPPAQSEE
jgi:putative restriction endonuclease